MIVARARAPRPIRAAVAVTWGRFGRPLRAGGVQHPAPTLFCTSRRDQDRLLVEAPFARAVLSGKNITADPPRTQLWALLYAQVRQADGQDWRNILLDDRDLDLIPRARGRLAGATGQTFQLGAFQDRDAGARGFTSWDQDEIIAMLDDLGLPRDAARSVLCVEMMPALESLAVKVPLDVRTATLDPMAGVLARRSGTASATGGTAVLESDIRPLSDDLGYYRILRTSPLTPVPEICCPNC